jgi:hypothetical protein
MTPPFSELLGNAILGIDTLWGGDVMSESGTGRFIADCWFSNEAMPAAYTHPAATRLRETGGVSGRHPDRQAVKAYIEGVNVADSIHAFSEEARATPGLRGSYLRGLALCFETMWEMVLEVLEEGPAVPYRQCVRASIGADPSPSDPSLKRRRVAELLERAGFRSVAEWRQAHRAPMASVRLLGEAFIARFDRLAELNLAPYLPAELRAVPRANIQFLPIQDAWFSGSMNYLGRKRQRDGSPEYEATYEINSSLEISVPEFAQLVSHEVVPGHVTTFAFLQNLYARRVVGFEASVLTMNTRAAALFEGIANNAILVAYGVTEVDQLPDEDLQMGVLLALLQDDAKNQASYLTWQEGWPRADVAEALQREFLVTEERAHKLSGAWGRHPLLGRMYLPAYRAGTEKVAQWRRQYPPDKLLPALYGCRGLVDITTLTTVLR